MFLVIRLSLFSCRNLTVSPVTKIPHSDSTHFNKKFIRTVLIIHPVILLYQIINKKESSHMIQI